MKKILAICCLVALVSCSSNDQKESASDQNPTPSLDEVLFHIYNKYEVKKSIAPSERLQVMKTPRGWEVGVRYYDDEGVKVKDQELLWSEQNKFQDLSISLKENTPEDKALLNEMYQTLGFYNNYPIFTARTKFQNKTFFGYENWLEDIVNYYSEHNPQTVSDKFNYASALYDKVFTDFRDHSVPQEEVEKGLKMMRSIKDSKEILTLVGYLDLKYANDVMGVYFNNKFIGLGYDDKMIDQFLTKDLYEDEAIVYAKTTLNSCPQGAILFTSGDNDTYPLIYVQKVMGVRTDVQIINRSLLQAPEYISFLAEKGVKTTVDPNVYESEISSYFVIEAPRQEKAFDFLKTLNVKTIETKSFNGENVAVFPYGLEVENMTPLQFEGTMITRSDLAGVDIMLSNDRQICFTNGLKIFSLPSKDFKQVGSLMFYKPMCNAEVINDLSHLIDSALTNPVVSSVSDYTPENRFLNLMSFGYYNLISYYQEQQETQKRDQVLKFYFDSFNPKKIHAAPTNYLLGLMYKGYFGKEYFPGEFESAKNQVIEQINGLISKSTDQYNWRDLEKMDDLLSEYTYLKQVETAKVPDFENDVENIKNKIQEILSQYPYFKLFILQSRNLQRIYMEIKS